MGWTRAEEALANSGGDFVKLENDGDKITVAFPFCGGGETDEPFVSEIIWDEKLEQAVPFTAEHKAEGKKPQYKYGFNVYSPKDDSLLIYQCSASTLKMILYNRDKHGLDKVFYEIKRDGAKGSKKTKYILGYDGVIPDKTLARIAELAKDRKDLSKVGNEDEKPATATTKSNGAASGTISEGVANELIPKLKELPADVRKAFLTEFKVAKVRDLKASDMTKITEWIAANTTKSEDAFG